MVSSQPETSPKTVVKRRQWLWNWGQWPWAGGSTYNVLRSGRKTITRTQEPSQNNGLAQRSLGVSPGTVLLPLWARVASSGGKAMPGGSSGRMAVLVPCITWSCAQEPRLMCLPAVVSLWMTLPGSVLIGWTLLSLPSFVRLSLDLAPTWGSLGVKDNSS